MAKKLRCWRKVEDVLKPLNYMKTKLPELCEYDSKTNTYNIPSLTKKNVEHKLTEAYKTCEG